jgi:hypothetical protein
MDRDGDGEVGAEDFEAAMDSVGTDTVRTAMRPMHLIAHNALTVCSLYADAQWLHS